MVNNSVRKKGAIHYEIIMVLILSLIFLGFAFIFIFGEYFNADELDWQQCRQSVILRANSPELQKGGITPISLKDTFPLKCKTRVVSISKQDVEKGEDGKIVADTLAQCWYMFLEGESQIFASQVYGFESYCVPCARIRFEEDAVSLNKKIDLWEVFNGKMAKREESYLDYFGDGFNPSVGVNYLIFDVDGGSKKFDISGDSFYVDDMATKGVLNTVKNYLIGGLADVTLPRYIDPSNGDVLVFVSQVVRSDKKKDLGGFNPLLFYFSVGQSQSPFDELKKDFIESGDWEASMCDTMDGVPA